MDGLHVEDNVYIFKEENPKSIKLYGGVGCAIGVSFNPALPPNYRM
jgi:hypothetical protein